LEGKISYLPNELFQNKEDLRIYNTSDYLTDLKLKLANAHENAKKNLINDKISRNDKQAYIKNSDFKINDYVYLKVGNHKKHCNPFKGPYKIIKQNYPNSTILINNKEKTYHNNNLIKCKINNYKDN